MTAERGRPSAGRKESARRNKEKKREFRLAQLRRIAERGSKGKLGVMVGFLITAMAALALVVLGIKLLFGEEYQNRALTQLINRSVAGGRVIEPNRGAIVDRSMSALAQSYMVYDAIMDVRNLINASPARQTRTVNRLAEITGLPERALWRYLNVGSADDDGRKPVPEQDTHYRRAALGLTYAQSRAIADDGVIQNITTEARSVREYMYDDLAADVIGFKTAADAFGIERQYDEYLAGTTGRIYRVYGGDDSFISGGVVTERASVKNGSTVVTTLDLRVQRIAEDAVKKYAALEDAENTAVIVMDPSTGEILAMAEYPSFNLNMATRAEGVNDPETAAKLAGLSGPELNDGLHKQWTNYNITDTFEPGSTFKPVTVAAGLEENIVTPESAFYCPGYRQIGGYTIHCHLLSGHGGENLEAALYNSCNVAMMDISGMEGRSIFYKYQRGFGFGEKTGVDLPLEESAAALLHSETGLNASELATASFGQRFNATPLQIITSFSAIINGGNLMRPYVVSKVIAEDGTVEFENTPTVARRVISKETSDWLRVSLESVITRGTGKKAAIPGYAIGGKTGTGEQGIAGTEDFHYTMSIETYFPVDNPRYAVLAVINRPASDTASPGPMSKEIMQNIINVMNLPPDRGEEAPADERPAAGAYVGRGLAEVSAELAALGLNAELIGPAGDTVTMQFPQTGAPMDPGATVVLTIGFAGEGAETVPIPNVVGMSEEEAIAALTASGLIPAVWRETPPEISETAEQPESPEASGETPPREAVTAQSPGQIGSEVVKGTTVRITVGIPEN
ncbi:MAG: PASTA domain-containing protein [Clostridiales bacterium]|jgi:stage V sporulation protein D (sporulation-specific penicillin-binding protein)|nr:PASTA domain-containing protein [Clostridiales bacterium]